MSGLTPPTVPHYRITLFFGPEPLAGDADTLQCVFNVKKRSWKAGIQIAVHLHQPFVATLRDRCGFEAWLTPVLSGLATPERETYRQRAEELLHVEIARLKLQEALERGLPQENHALPCGRYENRLSEAVARGRVAITTHIALELDLPAE